MRYLLILRAEVCQPEGPEFYCLQARRSIEAGEISGSCRAEQARQEHSR